MRLSRCLFLSRRRTHHAVAQPDDDDDGNRRVLQLAPQSLASCALRSFLIHSKEDSAGFGGWEPNQGSTGIRHDLDAVMTGVPWPAGWHPPLRWFGHATAPLWQCTRSSGQRRREALDRARNANQAQSSPRTCHSEAAPKASISFPRLTNRAAVYQKTWQAFECCHPPRRQWPAHTCSSMRQSREMEVRWSCVRSAESGRVRD